MAEMKKSKKNGANRCPHCGATDVTLDVKKGKLRCNYCRSVFDKKKTNAYGGVKTLKGEVVGDGAAPIIPDEKVIVTLKCPACGAEVVINTDEAVSARCHWCRHTLSLNEKMGNGAVPDLVLPFSYEKTKAEEKIREFVNKRRFYAHPTFRKEFKPENVMGVYLPYMIVDVNAHAKMAGEAEHLIRSYTSGGKNKRRYYDAEAFKVTREFDLYVDDLTIEASSDKLKQDVRTNTNNIINAVMPFDTDNCEEWTPNYLHGYASERRDTNVADLRDQLKLQVGDIARYRVKESMSYYNRGAKWTSEDIDTKGMLWKSAYLPVWLYSYMQTTKKGNMLHYVAVNGRTGETMGSVPINKTRLRIVSTIIEIIGIIIGYEWIKFWLHVDVDDDNPFLYGLAGLTPGFIYYWVMTARYRNMNARHKHEAETKSDIENLQKTDESIGRRNHLSSPRIAGENDSVVKGVVASGNFKMMGEKMANILGVGRMVGSKAHETTIGQKAIADEEKAKKRRSIVVAVVTITIIMTVMFVAAVALSAYKRGRSSGSYREANMSRLRSDMRSVAKSNGYEFSTRLSWGACIKPSRDSKSLSCFKASDLKGKTGFEITKEMRGGNDLAGLRDLEFLTPSEDTIHSTLVRNNIKYRKTFLTDEGNTRMSSYMSGEYDSKKNIHCTLMEHQESKGDYELYEYSIVLTCVELNRSDYELGTNNT